MGEPFALEADADATAAAANLVVVLADNKYFLAHRLAEWGVGAPSLESAVACTAIAQEEAGHARGLYALLEEFPAELAPVQLEREDDRARKYCVSYVLEPTASWYHAVAALVLLDRALTTILSAAIGSTLPGLQKRAVRILADESFHRRYADGRLRELAADPAEAAVLQSRLVALLPETLCLFGPKDEPGLESLVAAGVVSAANEELRQGFVAALVPAVARAGLALPLETANDGSWSYAELPWTEWNRLERRLSAAMTTAP
jgi:1,2-phenylacetyl-CoA epoxidase catalytic subunit